MKQLESLKKDLEKHFEVSFESLIDYKSGENYYVPKPSHNLSSTKYWLIFVESAVGTKAIAGDFSNPENTFTKKISFNIDAIKTISKPPNPKKYLEGLEKLHLKIKKFISLKKQGSGAYLSDFKCLTKLIYTDQNSSEVCYIPYKNIQTEKYTGILKIDSKGVKRWVKGSQVNSTYVKVKEAESEGLYYICEGIRTALIVAQACPKSSGVISVGSVYNLENIVKAFSAKNFKLVLCSEKESLDIYQKIKLKYGTLLVGASKYSDLYDYYKATNIDCLKKILVSYTEKTFIVLGLQSSDCLQVYLKSRGNVVEYKQAEASLLLADCHDIGFEPDAKEAKKFYWKLRQTARIKGLANEDYVPVKEGIFPYGESFVFFDRRNLYLIKENGELLNLDVMENITPQGVFIRSDFPNNFDFTKVKPISIEELRYIEETLNLFDLTSLEKKLVLGWVFQSLLCGGLDHRTPIWIHGSSYSGKTWLTSQFLMKLFLYCEKGYGRNTTPRYLVRKLNGKATPLLREEMEDNTFKIADTLEEMEYLRETVTDRFPKRGIASGKERVKTYTFCFSTIFASIKIPRGLTKADLDRILFFKLKRKEATSFQTKIAEFNSFMTSKKRASLLKYALTNLMDVRKKFNLLLKDSSFKKYTTHKRSSVLSLVACYNTCMKEVSKPISKEEILKILSSQSQTKLDAPSSKILIDILSLKISERDFNVLGNLTLLERLKCYTDDLNQKFLNSNGIYLHFGKSKVLLCIDLKKGVYLFQRLFKESRGNFQTSDAETLKQLLSTDGEFLLQVDREVRSLNRKVYNIYDFSLILRAILGEEFN